MKNKRIILVFPALIWLGALIFASFYDLDISLRVANTMLPFGRVLEILGEIPAILFTSFNFAIISVYLLRREGHIGKDRLISALTIFLSVGTAYYTSNATIEYIEKWRNDLSLDSFGDSVKLAAALIFAACLTALFLFYAFKINFEKLENMFGIALHCVSAAILTFVVIWIFKLMWSRVRFRQLTDLSQFTPFYIPNGFKGLSGYYSFPSGHTANATVILTLSYYFGFLKKKNLKPIFYLLLFLWIVIVALSRVLVGAHYLSDVLCAVAITSFIVYICRPKIRLL